MAADPDIDNQSRVRCTLIQSQLHLDIWIQFQEDGTRAHLTLRNLEYTMFTLVFHYYSEYDNIRRLG